MTAVFQVLGCRSMSSDASPACDLGVFYRWQYRCHRYSKCSPISLLWTHRPHTEMVVVVVVVVTVVLAEDGSKSCSIASDAI